MRRIHYSDWCPRPVRRAGRNTLALALSAATLVGVLGCDDDDATNPFVRSIGMSLSAGALSLEQGETGTVDVTLSRRGGFAGGITLEVTGVPAGVTASFDPTPVMGGTSSTLTLAAEASAVPGTYTLTVTASGAGVASRSATLSLTITTPPESPFIDVVLGASDLSIVQGQSGTVSVDITRGGGYTGDVALALSGAPAGITATFTPPSVVGAASSVLTLSADASTAPGTYTLTVTGSGTGVASASATLTLTITPAPPPTGSIAVAVNAANNLLWVVQGASKDWEVIVTRSGSFTGPVNLSITGLPAGVTAVFSLPTLGPGTNGSLLTLTAQSGAALGTTNATIRATGAGVADATLVVQVSVVAVAP